MEKKIDWEKVKKVGGIVANVVIWLFVVFSILVTVLVFAAQGNADGIPELFGKTLITIETESMEPNINRGSLVVLTKLEPGEIYELGKDDIITYRSPVDLNGDGKAGDINTHRIISNNTEGFYFVTKGDNNDLPDNEGDNPYVVKYTDVIGKCTERDAIGGIGAVIGFLRSSVGFLVCIVLPLVLFFLYELYNLISIIVTERAKRAPVSGEVEEEIKRRAIEEYLKSQQNNEKTEEKSDDEPKAE
ncbi:MAG: signal peptidase I [Clostridia bacterium]|nr:signal peptidase I [Clostridia bacterium]